MYSREERKGGHVAVYCPAGDCKAICREGQKDPVVFAGVVPRTNLAKLERAAYQREVDATSRDRVHDHLSSLTSTHTIVARTNGASKRLLHKPFCMLISTYIFFSRRLYSAMSFISEISEI